MKKKGLNSKNNMWMELWGICANTQQNYLNHISIYLTIILYWSLCRHKTGKLRKASTYAEIRAPSFYLPITQILLNFNNYPVVMYRSEIMLGSEDRWKNIACSRGENVEADVMCGVHVDKSDVRKWRKWKVHCLSWYYQDWLTKINCSVRLTVASAVAEGSIPRLR